MNRSLDAEALTEVSGGALWRGVNSTRENGLSSEASCLHCAEMALTTISEL